MARQGVNLPMSSTAQKANQKNIHDIQIITIVNDLVYAPRVSDRCIS